MLLRSNQVGSIRFLCSILCYAPGICQGDRHDMVGRQHTQAAALAGAFAELGDAIRAHIAWNTQPAPGCQLCAFSTAGEE